MNVFGLRLQCTSAQIRQRLAMTTQRRNAIALHVQQRTMSHFRVIEHTVRCQHVRERRGATELGQANKLRMAVKQYVPRTNPDPAPGGVTFIGAHANGFPKELYEPLWDDLYKKMNAQGRKIRSIWIADVAHQGQSGVLNEKILGDDPSWFDHARDLLFFINQYQDEMPHPIFAIGHSFGGNQLTHLALFHPSLFQGLILIDPVMQVENPAKPFAPLSTYRRDIWPSREDALQRFQSNPVYKKWDPRVLDKLVKHGLRELPTELYPQADGEKPVTLTTTKAQELYTFWRPNYEGGKVGLKEGEWRNEMLPEEIDGNLPFYSPEPPRIFHRLGEVKPSVLYVFGEQSDLSTPEARQKKMEMTGTGVGGSGGAAKGRVKEVTLPVGHLVPMEQATETAAAAASFVDAELTRWESETALFEEQWRQKPRSERIALDEAWKQHVEVLLPRRQKRKEKL